MCICTLVQNRSIIYCTTKNKLCKRPAAILSTKKETSRKVSFDLILFQLIIALQTKQNKDVDHITCNVQQHDFTEMIVSSLHFYH